jgi:8-oxo-dGTP pyrophosphatase MutT (NUDIX family)
VGTTQGKLPIAPAATVVVVRDTRTGPEVLLVQRANELAFHGGAWVFPGGRVDPGDHEGGVLPERALSQAEVLAVARRAAIREAREESGLDLHIDALSTVSHWTTPEGRPRRFATWFFAALLEDAREVVVDGGEIRAHRWLRAEQALALREAGELELPPPTYVTLSMMTPYESSTRWFASLRHAEPPVYVPHPRITLGGVISLYHGDAAYDADDLDVPGPRHRLNMLASGWHYQRD